jgi:hypothetical protein
LCLVELRDWTPDPLHPMQFLASQVVQVRGARPAHRPPRSDRDCPWDTAGDRCLWHAGGTAGEDDLAHRGASSLHLDCRVRPVLSNHRIVGKPLQTARQLLRFCPLADAGRSSSPRPGSGSGGRARRGRRFELRGRRPAVRLTLVSVGWLSRPGYDQEDTDQPGPISAALSRSSFHYWLDFRAAGTGSGLVANERVQSRTAIERNRLWPPPRGVAEAMAAGWLGAALGP